VQFILRHERQHALRFAALESETGRRIRARHPSLAEVDSMVWVENADRSDERVLVRSAAGLSIARYMGGLWRFALLASLIPRPVRDAVYDFIARHRHTLAGDSDRCYVPAPSVRERFLDLTS
jgi:predicted DCC family thiol-disulfide oxidoreductase YuxK